MVHTLVTNKIIHFLDIFQKADKREKIRLILILLSMSLAFSIPFGEQYSKKIILMEFIIWLFYVKTGEIKQIFSNHITKIIVIFILLHIFALIYSEHLHLGWHQTSQLFRYFLLPIVMIMSIVKDKRDIQIIIGAFVFSMFINEIISYLIYFDLYQTEFSKTRGYPVGFINHIQYSVLVAFSAILILYQSRLVQNKMLKIVYIIFFMTMTTNLVISSGRTGYFIYFASLVILLFIYFKFSIKNFLQVLLFPTVVFYLGYTFNDSVQARFNATMLDIKKVEENNYNGSIGARLAFYPITYDILKQKNNSFIFGAGMGDIPYELEQATKRTGLIKTIYPHLHSSYLTAYVNTGIIGLLILLYLVYSLFKLPIEDKEIRFVKLLFLLNFSLGMIPDILLTQKTTMIYFSVFIGLILAQYKLEKSKGNA